MGLLDDAIREHLELKRRRGADADEVDRLEQEALGPPQRGEFVDAAPAAEPVTVTPEPEAAPEPEPELAEPESVVPQPEPEPDPDPIVAVRAEREPDAAEPARAAEGEDVLEETPDFLQETPEHDRLWFEQKPPRDFDLDR